MFRSTFSALRGPLCAAAFSILGLAGCGLGTSGGGFVDPTVNLIDHTVQGLVLVGNFTAARGSYGSSCEYRSSSGKWAVPINSAVLSQDEDILSVKLGDTACTLTLEELDSDSKPYTGQPNINLTQMYPVGASSFIFMTDPVAFYGTAKLRSSEGALFSSNFFIDVVYSDNAARIDRDILSQYAVVTATAQAANVPTPVYTVDTSSLSLKVNAQKKLDVAATGNVVLTKGSQAGLMYALTQTDPSTTISSIDAAYAAANVKVAISASPVNIAANAFSLSAGTQLPQHWYVIVANYDTNAPSTRSYQVFGLNFLAPP